jgi:Peptidase family M23
VKLLFALLALFAIPAVAEVTVAVHPQRVRVETFRHAQALNFDFEIRNDGTTPVRIYEVHVDVLDRDGKVVHRRRINSQAISPSMLTVPKRDVAPKSRLWLFNPFHTFPAGLPIARLDYTFRVGPPDSDEWLAPIKVTITPEAARTKTVLRVPMRGRVIVDDGHDFYAHHRRLDLTHPLLESLRVDKNPSRYALDLCVIDADGKLHRGDGRKREDWLSWEAPVVAAANGKVVEARGDRQDFVMNETSFDYGELAKDDTAINGNYVVVDHGSGEYSIYVHLRQGSVRVKPGDTVRAGDAIAKIGLSGDAFFPHLHFELRDGTSLRSNGLPAYFKGFRRSYEKSNVPSPEPIDTGDIVIAP